ncbi:leucine-rich repeat protein 1 [Tribolium castaneum]|uniref:Leucine-rich repeat protein 1-like Protein n=1 Tax=Tribolium castaneum TaxID=7070 RepID=D6WTS9_TRICA|nr:PREDICTED: leucine-rich repeat protein 1 [Tribolium castaneum]EFA06739.1 Leucine-rich repeat protein 1-like Protein [Tribolium castaneum]|eukprot:XP_015836852.1 PREDICTED: leucine-rich repeat protein 1 [Tribolium castaneum]
MKLVCSVRVENRLLPALAIKSKQKYAQSTLALCKHPNSEDYCIILFTNQNKNGTKYGVRGNISQILTRFINDGKATIQFKMPPHDLFVQCDVLQLKSFLHLLKRVLENKISPKELTCSSMSVTPVAKNTAPKKLVIRSRAEYPARGFPRTLESLYVNGIKRCGLDIGILRLTKLKILDLSQNCIEFIPEELNKLHLSEVNLSQNCLNKSSPRQWAWLGGNLSKSLTLLNLESNNLKYLPDQLAKLYNLITLNVNNNELKFLPNCLSNLRNLRNLVASNNNLTVLPGSIKQCRFKFLDLFNNNFEANSTEKIAPPTHLPVFSLKECAGRRVLELKLFYSSNTIPHTLVKYLDCAKYCECGKACFESFIRVPGSFLVSGITEDLIVSPNSMMLPLDCYFCSLRCFRTLHFTRSRNPVIR